MSAPDPKDCRRWWGFSHRWGRWSVVKQEVIVSAETEEPVGTAIIQKRTCERCGLEQWYMQKAKL